MYVLSTDNTCSASEALINGLKGIDAEVILIGGKPAVNPMVLPQRITVRPLTTPFNFQAQIIKVLVNTQTV